MFNKSFKARIDGWDTRIRRQKGNNEELAYVRLHLLFEFSEEVASEIGGPAPDVHRTMVTVFDQGSVGAVPISLNARAVNVRFRIGNKHHVVKETIAVGLRATPATARSVSPMLHAAVSFLAGPNDIAMLWDNMGRQVGVRMDREQLELPGMGEPTEGGDEEWDEAEAQ